MTSSLGKRISIVNKGLRRSRRSFLVKKVFCFQRWILSSPLNEVIKVTRFRELSRHPSSVYQCPLLVDMILLWTNGPSNDSRIRPINHLRQIPFVRDLRYVAPPDGPDRGYDGKIEVQTPSGRFQLLVEAKRSFLTRSAVNQLLAWVKQVGTGKPHRLFCWHVTSLVRLRSAFWKPRLTSPTTWETSISHWETATIGPSLANQHWHPCQSGALSVRLSSNYFSSS